MTMRVAHLAIFPEQDEPGVDLSTATVQDDGLTGDRRKKAPILLVTLADVAARPDRPPRANVVVDPAGHDLRDLVGKQLRVGSATLGVTVPPGGCPGVYADVLEPGQVSVGDDIDVL